MADLISELPDQLLVDILSLLTIREAVSTSFISRRWKHLWTYSTGTFDFDFGSSAITEMKQAFEYTSLETERSKYIDRVNKFTRSHNGSTIDAFMIKFDLRRESAKDIDSWIDFAMRKRVGTLQLDLAHVDLQPKMVTLHVASLTTDSVYSLESLDYQKLNLSWLKNLNLNSVHINRETVEYILSNSPVLEYLRISICPGLYGVRVVATCPKLRHLEIAHCESLEFLEISSAPNLVSFSYSGPIIIRLCFRDAPKMVDVSLQAGYCSEIIEKFHELPLALSRIQKLKLHTCGDIGPCFNKFPELQRVTELELNLGSCLDGYSLLSSTHAIKACPNLYRLSVQFTWLNSPEPRFIAKAEQGKGQMNERLKVVEVGGFRGTATDVELVMHILSTSPFLEKIKVDTVKLDDTYLRPRIRYGDEMNNHAKKFAIRLASQFSPFAQLLVR